ncbi:MAG: EFR1 family ferrodoxin [Deltaproteobacteria bacterium]|nr:EFR1 family ferrodoxin [Deltaproteobacteria bacterium]
MPLPIRKALIVYCSPGGSTEHVARVMEANIRAHGMPLTMVDLGREQDIPFILSQLPAAKENLCLMIGSPVYAMHPVPPVMEFLKCLPVAEGGYAVPFVTWGGVSSGIALHLMGQELESKGYTLLGAAKVLARHSMMWACDDAQGRGHPDREDERMIGELVDMVCAKLKLPDPPGLSLSQLDYQPRDRHDFMSTLGIQAVRALMPERKLERERCTGCGVCVENCPVNAIELTPYPEFGPSCICCFNCVRLCPEQALTADLSVNMERIRIMTERFSEPEGTRTFN